LTAGSFEFSATEFKKYEGRVKEATRRLLRRRLLMKQLTLTVVPLAATLTLVVSLGLAWGAEADKAKFVYAVKALCFPGLDVQTRINVHNPNAVRVEFTKKRIRLRVGQQPIRPTPAEQETLDPGWAFQMNCRDIAIAVPEGFLEGFVIFESPRQLDVWAVYEELFGLGGRITRGIEVVQVKATRLDD